MRWKFLFIKFRPDRFWWAVTFLIRGAVLNFGVLIFRNGFAQIFWMIFCVIVYQMMAVWFMPWRHTVSNFVDIGAMTCLILSGACMLWFSKDSVSDADIKEYDANLTSFAIA